MVCKECETILMIASLESGDAKSLARTTPVPRTAEEQSTKTAKTPAVAAVSRSRLRVYGKAPKPSLIAIRAARDFAVRVPFVG